MVHLLPVPNMEWAVYELCLVPTWALLRQQGLGSTGVVASQDPTPRGRGGGGGFTDPKMVLRNNGFVGFGGHLLNKAK